MAYMYALYAVQTRQRFTAPCMYALYMACMYALYVCLICMAYMYALYAVQARQRHTAHVSSAPYA